MKIISDVLFAWVFSFNREIGYSQCSSATNNFNPNGYLLNWPSCANENIRFCPYINRQIAKLN